MRTDMVLLNNMTTLTTQILWHMIQWRIYPKSPLVSATMK